MRESETYAEFARECRRLASKATPSDRAVLLKIAEAWDEQARIAGTKPVKTDGGSRPTPPSD
jgi:hypothetical protein